MSPITAAILLLLITAVAPISSVPTLGRLMGWVLITLMFLCYLGLVLVTEGPRSVWTEVRNEIESMRRSSLMGQIFPKEVSPTK